MKPRNVLVAVDGSEPSREAVDLAVELVAASGSDARVVFLHVVPPPRERSVAVGGEEEAYTQEATEARDAVLHDAADVARARGVQVEVETATGDGTDETVDAIVGVAAGRGADLIIVGSRGRGAIAGVVLGSVSQGVLRYSEVPVLVVKGAGAGD